MAFKRAVSPLIATILIVALTVAIGSLIISWGQTYVKTKVNCLRYALTIYELRQGATNTELLVRVENTGTVSIDLQNDQDFAFVITLTDGSAKTCRLGTTPPANGCVIEQVSGDQLEPGEIQTLKILLGTGLTVDQVESGYFKYGTCGQISNEAYIL